MTEKPQTTPPIFEAVVNGDELNSYDPIEKITIHVKNGYSYDLTPMECTQLVCRVKKDVF